MMKGNGNNEIIDELWIYALAIKYWLQGDDWISAVEYSRAIVKGWKK